MKKTLALLFALSFVASVALADTAAPQTADPQQNNRLTIEVVQKPAPAPVVAPNTPASDAAAKVNEWVDVGTNIGTAIGAGLKSVAHDLKDETFGRGVSLVDGLDKVSHTDAGRFTMAVIAWKVAGRDALDLLQRFIGVLVGVPIQIVIVFAALWVTRRFTMTYSVKSKVTGPWWSNTRVVEYKLVNDDLESDYRYGVLFATWIIAIIISLLNIGFVIF